MPVLTLPVPDFLREDTPVGTSFLRAAAHDDDQGTNAAITYSLSQQSPAYFHINPSTGWIYVNQPISQVHIPHTHTQVYLAFKMGTCHRLVHIYCMYIHIYDPGWPNEHIFKN